MTVLLALFSIGTAHAAAPQWSWADGAKHRYVLEMKVQTPYVMWLLEEKNAEVRLSLVALQAVVDCAVAEPLPKDEGWLVRCPVQDASFFALPILADQGRSQPVVDEYEQLLEKETVEFRLHKDGRVSRVDLVGIEKHDERSGYILDHLTRYVERAVSAMDVALPPADPAPESWPHKGFLPAEMPTTSTATGNVKAKEALGPVDGAVDEIDTVASGSLTVGVDVWKVDAKGAAKFDTAAGALQSSWVEVTSSPGSATIGANTIPFLLDASATEVAQDAVVELKPSTGF